MEWNGDTWGGRSQFQVYRDFNVTPNVVSSLWKSTYKVKGPLRERLDKAAQEPRRPKIIAICFYSKQNRDVIAFQLSREFYATTERRVPKVFASRRRHKRALFARRLVDPIPLSSADKRIHLDGADIIDWSTDEWLNALFHVDSRLSNHRFSTYFHM